MDEAKDAARTSAPPRKKRREGIIGGAAAAAPSENGGDSAKRLLHRRRRHISIPALRVDDGASGGRLVPYEEFREAYDGYQAVYLPDALGQSGFEGASEKSRGGGGGEVLKWRDLAGLFSSLCEADRKSWTVENADGDDDAKKIDEEEPGAFLRPESKRKGYCSFLVQHDSEAMREILDRAPMAELPIGRPSNAHDEGRGGRGVARGEGEAKSSPRRTAVRHGPCLWIFFGRNVVDRGGGGKGHGGGGEENSAPPPLKGRPEHTDSVSYDGTWHYQLSGSKVWGLRPTAELLRRMKDRGADEDEVEAWSGRRRDSSIGEGGTRTARFEVTCREGDALLVNTRLWWHATTIPAQDVPSVSYVRDVYFNHLSSSSGGETVTEAKEGARASDGKEGAFNAARYGTMTNLDGLYAADDIEAGTVIFTERTMPDCELHRSKNDPNCEVVELEDGTDAVASLRDIRAGEFFCVAESDDNDDDEEEEGGEDGGGSGSEVEESEDGLDDEENG